MYKSIFKTYIIFVSGGILLYFLQVLFLDIFSEGFSNVERNCTIIDMIVVSLVIAPIIETLIFQYLILKLPFRFFRLKKTKLNVITLCAISSLIFGSQHYYNIGYMIFATILGFYLSFTFTYVEFKSENRISGYKLVVSIHFFINLTAFLLNYIL